MSNEANTLLGITYLTEGQGQKEPTVNTAWDILTKASVGYLTKSVAGAIDVTLTATEWENTMFAFTGVITASINVIVPITTRMFMVYNNTTGAFTLTVKTAAGTGIAVGQGTRALLVGDGVNVVSLVSGGASYTDEQAQDTVGGMVDASMFYTDGTPLLGVLGAAGSFSLFGDISPTQIAANTDDYAPTGLATASILRLSTDASRNLTGITGGADGRILGILNIGSFPLVLKDDVTSTAANRFQLSGDITLDPEEGALLYYDATSTRWRLLGLYKASTSTQGKHTIWVPASAMTPSTTEGSVAASFETSTNKNNHRVLQFANGASALYAHFNIAFPKAWDEGTVTYSVYWTLNSTATDTAVFGLQGVALSDSDALDVAFGTAIEVSDDGLGTARDLHVSAESAAITIAGTPAAEDMINFRFYRDPTDGADDLAQTVELLGIKLYYTTSGNTDI